MPNEEMQKLILLVDDSKDVRDVYTRCLKEEGFRVAPATDGQEALDEAAKLQPDLILMDLSLPGIGGWAATQRLKKQQKTKHIPIVILTGHSLEGAETVIKESCEGFLIKPCIPDDLVKEVARVLRNAASREDSGRRQRTSVQ